jgi:hypothetical protein
MASTTQVNTPCRHDHGKVKQVGIIHVVPCSYSSSSGIWLTTLTPEQNEREDMIKTVRVLHDYDNPYPSGRWALERGLKLILYAASKKLPFLRRYCRSVYDECYEHMWTLHQIDSLLGIKSIFGINDDVVKAYPDLQPDVLRGHGLNAVRHWHRSSNEVHWHPELDVPQTNWWFDIQYACGQRKPQKDEWLVFHCDYPHLLPHYVRCLYELVAKRPDESGEKKE